MPCPTPMHMVHSAYLRALGKPQSVVYDVKHVLPRIAVDGRL